MNGQLLRALVRVYDIGAITVALRVAPVVGSFQELAAFHNPRLEDGSTLDQLARRLCAEVRAAYFD